MKYQPPKMDELSPEQLALYKDILAEEKAELNSLKSDHETRERSEAYHVATKALITERAGSESAFVIDGSVSDEEFENAFMEYDAVPAFVSARPVIKSRKFSLHTKNVAVRKAVRFRRLKTNKSPVSDAVHAVVAKSGSKS